MLDENIEKYGAQSILLRFEPLSMDFTLPSRSSDGVTISPDKKRRIFYSNDLEINYYTYIREGKAHFVLFDSANSIRRKLAIAQSKNIDSIIIPPREMQNFGIDMR